MLKVDKRTELEDFSDVLSAFAALGFKDVDFGSEFETMYKDYHWVLMPHAAAVTRLYAIPPENELLKRPWDSWYFLNGAPTHHVHLAWKPDDNWIPWIQKGHAPECPDELTDIQWFWYAPTSMIPSMLMK